MIIELCLERRRIEEDEDGDGEEDDDVERVHHQPGDQQPPRPFLQCTQLRQKVIEELGLRHIDLCVKYLQVED